jgi:hypothetical protein
MEIISITILVVGIVVITCSLGYLLIQLYKMKQPHAEFLHVSLLPERS